MSNIELLAFVILPITVGALAWIIAWANDYFSDHQTKNTPSSHS